MFQFDWRRLHKGKYIRVTIDFDSRLFHDMMNDRRFINIELDSKFTINEAEGVPEELPVPTRFH